MGSLFRKVYNSLVFTTLVCCLMIFAITVLDNIRTKNYLKNYASRTVILGRTPKRFAVSSCSRKQYNLPASSTRKDNVVFANPIVCDLDTLRICRIDDPLSCFFCRNFNSKCVHFEENVEVRTTHGEVDVTGDKRFVVPKNASPKEGYCVHLDESGVETKKCNSNTGRWVLIRKNIDDTIDRSDDDDEVMDAVTAATASSDFANSRSIEPDIFYVAYSWYCACTYPHLVTQRNILGDCDLDVACNGYGHLENVEVDPYLFGKCVCDDDHVSDHLKGYGPYCRTKRFYEVDKDSDLYSERDWSLLSIYHEAIDPKFASQFTHGERRHVPNPCHVDALTGENIAGGCYLVKTFLTTEKQFVWYCEAAKPQFGTILYDDDYLNNNGGRYANGCYRLLRDDAVTTTTSIDSEISEWYNKRGNDTTTEFALANYGLAVRSPAKELTKAVAVVCELISKSVEWRRLLVRRGFDHDEISRSGNGTTVVFAYRHATPTSMDDRMIHSDKEGGDTPEKPVVMMHPPFWFVTWSGTASYDSIDARKCSELGKTGSWPRVVVWQGNFTSIADNVRLLIEGFDVCLWTKEDQVIRRNPESTRAYVDRIVPNNMSQTFTGILECVRDQGFHHFDGSLFDEREKRCLRSSLTNDIIQVVRE